jgi:hypothetical protein
MNDIPQLIGGGVVPQKDSIIVAIFHMFSSLPYFSHMNAKLSIGKMVRDLLAGVATIITNSQIPILSVNDYRAMC